MEILVVSAISLAATAFVLWPLIRGGATPAKVFVPQTDGDRERLLWEKEAAVKALKEIEFDYLAGKLSHEDYVSLNVSYENRVVKLLKKLDEHDASDPLTQALEDEIIEARKRRRGESCPQCSYAASMGYKYCASCGAAINRDWINGR